MEALEIMNIDQAIQQLIKHREKFGNKIMVCMVDLDTGDSKREKKTIEESCCIIRKSNTIAFNNDDFFPHIMAFSAMPKEKQLLPDTGRMHDFFLSHKKIV